MNPQILFTFLASSFFLARAEIVPVKLPSAFSGSQSGIGSWYQADSSQDSTNGNSWCGYTYTNADPLFAPSLALMGGATYSSNAAAWTQQTQTYCGLEANVTDPSNGNTKLLYIGDSFASPRSAGSIDIMLDGWEYLYGSNPNGDKDIVINPVDWYLTGNINTDWTAPGEDVSSRTVAGTTVAPTTTKSTSPTSTCDWGCYGWDCSATVPCQTPWSCVNGYCKSATTTTATATATSTAAPGTLGASCGLTVTCDSGLTCLSPSGICSNAACNWGCTTWDCSTTSPCQLPNTCVNGICEP